MYVLIYLIVLGVSTYLTNKTNEVESSDEFLQWSKQDIATIGGVLALGIILEAIGKTLPIVLLGVYFVVCMLAFVAVNKSREKTIQQFKEHVNQIYEATAKLTNIKKEDLSYSDLPFKLEQEDGRISQIIVKMTEPSKFTDGNCINAVYSLNRFFPYCSWKYVVDFPKQECYFIGQKLPPEIANWPGDNLRGSVYIPLGVAGDGEVGWPLANSKKKWGESSFVFDDGEKAGTVDLPSAPQCLTVGSPLDIHTIIPTKDGYKQLSDLQFGDTVFDITGKQTKVIGISPKQMSLSSYRLEFKYNDDINFVNSDYKHKFPVIHDNGTIIMTECVNLKCGDAIAGNNGSKWILADKTPIDNRVVMCIKVDSDTHMFLFDNRRDQMWHGGEIYTKTTVATSNTGGGKAIYIEQEIW